MLGLALLQADITSVPVLIAIAMIIVIGYVAKAIFNRTKIPEALILIGIGVLLVPILHLLSDQYVNALRSSAAIIGDVALVIIMFNGGKIIGFDHELFKDKIGLMLGILDSLVPMIIIAIVMQLLFNWPLIDGALLGAILGETSTVIIIPMLRKFKMQERMYNSLVLETTLNSVFAILFFILLLSFANGEPFSIGAFATLTIDYISVAIAFGLVFGFAWLAIQNYIKGAKEYLATIAMAIFLFGIVDLFNGAGAIAVLIFAIILGNYRPIANFFGFKLDSKKNEIGERNAVERDIEFLIITFFFIFIGMIAIISWQSFLYAIVITAILLFVRFFEVKYVIDGNKLFRDFAFALMQRGTVVAVLAAILFSIGGFYFDQIFYISFMVIILTNIIAAMLLSKTKLELNKR